MAVNSEFIDHVLDLLAPLGGVAARPMFGGVGLYLDGIMFGLISSKGGFYFRVDDQNRGDFEAAGTGPFKPFDGKPQTMPYFEVPAEAMEAEEALSEWGWKAWKAACRAKGAKTKSRAEGANK